MKRLSVLATALFVGSALGPNGAARAADQIYACVNTSSGEIKLVAQNATCKNNETLVVWNVVGPQGLIGPPGPPGPTGPAGPAGPAGVLAGSSFLCGGPGSAGGFVNFFAQPVAFGAGISTSGSTFNSIVLQPGIYQIHLSADRILATRDTFGILPDILLNLNGTLANLWAITDALSVAGDVFLRVTSPNSIIQFSSSDPSTPYTLSNCRLAILRLQ
jgi:hypothetical protein